MSKTNKIIAIVIVVAIALVGIGYAAITAMQLTINGTATADPNQSNFSVKFDQDTVPTTGNGVTAEVTDDNTATMSVTGLVAVGDTATATYTIKNESGDLSANLAAVVTQTNEDYFQVDKEIAQTTITKGASTTVKVTVKLIKTPVAEQVSDTITVKVTASPVQPN